MYANNYKSLDNNYVSLQDIECPEGCIPKDEASWSLISGFLLGMTSGYMLKVIFFK